MTSARGPLLVTGACGLLGHAVLEQAAHAYVCIGVDAVAPDEPLENVRYVQADLRDEAALQALVSSHAVTHVVHAGAISGPMLLTDAPAAVVAINVGGTQNVLETARVGRVQRIVVLSSAAVYGSNPPDAVVRESAPMRPASIYGCSKAAAEMLVLGYATCFDLASVILRPVSIYGPRRRTQSLISYLVANAIDRLPSRITTGPEPLDFIYVDDVARAVLLAIDCPSAVGRTYTIGSGAPTTPAEIVATIQRLLPDARIDVTWRPDSGSAEGRFDVGAASRDLGFRSEWDLERGLRRVIDVMRARADLRQAARAAWPSSA